jgi:hypothetical protein
MVQLPTKKMAVFTATVLLDASHVSSAAIFNLSLGFSNYALRGCVEM